MPSSRSHRSARVDAVPTIADIAGHLGLSKATVSYALRGIGEVSESTRLRVVEAAQELGYRPHAAAALLAHQRHRPARRRERLGVVWLTGLTAHDTGIGGFLETSESLGLDADTASLEEFGTPQRALRTLWQRGIEGIYFDAEWFARWNGAAAESGWAEAGWERFAVVKHTRVWPTMRFHLVRHSAFDFMMETLAATFQAGYRRLAVLLMRSASPQDDCARIGAVHAFREERMPEGGSIVLWKAPGLDRDRALPIDLQRWLEQHAPDAVVGFPYPWYEALKQTGYQIPRQMGFSTVYTHPDLAHLRHVSGCETGMHEIGCRAAQRLYRMLQIGERGQVRHPIEDVIEPVWHTGQTLPPRDTRKALHPAKPRRGKPTA